MAEAGADPSLQRSAAHNLRINSRLEHRLQGVGLALSTPKPPESSPRKLHTARVSAETLRAEDEALDPLEIGGVRRLTARRRWRWRTPALTLTPTVRRSTAVTATVWSLSAPLRTSTSSVVCRSRGGHRSRNNHKGGNRSRSCGRSVRDIVRVPDATVVNDVLRDRRVNAATTMCTQCDLGQSCQVNPIVLAVNRGTRWGRNHRKRQDQGDWRGWWTDRRGDRQHDDGGVVVRHPRAIGQMLHVATGAIADLARRRISVRLGCNGTDKPQLDDRAHTSGTAHDANTG